VAFGENIRDALMREMTEEIGIRGELKVQLLEQYIWESDIERELVFLFKTVTDLEPHPDKKELDGGQFWSKKEIQDTLGKGIFTPNFELEFNKLYRH